MRRKRHPRERLLYAHALIGQARLVAAIGEGRDKDIRRCIERILDRASKEIIRVIDETPSDDRSAP
jgi:ribosomal protein S5